jgi:hypothetical protein
MKRHVSSLLSLCVAVIVVACADGSRSGSSITGPASTARLDSLDSLPPDSLPPDSLPPDSLPPDSLPPDSLPPDSLPPLPPDSLPPVDTLPPDSLGSLRSLRLGPIAAKKAALKSRDHKLMLLLKQED